MNNRTKAIYSLVAGVALVGATGGQTLALWSDTQSQVGTPIVSGTLALTHDATWDWAIMREGEPVPVENQTTGNNLGVTVRAGDVITATTYISAQLASTNLTARVTPTQPVGALPVGIPVAPNVREEHWEAFLNINADQWETTVTVGSAAPNASLEGLATTEQVPVVVTINVPADLVAIPPGFLGIPVQNVSFGSFTITLEQTRSGA